MRRWMIIVGVVAVFLFGALVGSTKPPEIIKVPDAIYVDRKIRIVDFTQELELMQIYANTAGLKLWDKKEYDKYIEDTEVKLKEAEGDLRFHMLEIEQEKHKHWTEGYYEGFRKAKELDRREK